jgi:hypothetical protein
MTANNLVDRLELELPMSRQQRTSPHLALRVFLSLRERIEVRATAGRSTAPFTTIASAIREMASQSPDLFSEFLVRRARYFMKKSRLLFPFIAAFIAISSLRGTTVIPPTFDELVSRAQVIFQGVVTDVRSQWAGEGAQHTIVSFVTFKVEDALKGNPGNTYTVRMLGGTVDNRTIEVTDGPKFKVGDRDVLFVENNGSQFIPLVGIMHGRFRIERELAGEREIVKTNEGEPLSDISKLGRNERAARAGAALSVDQFKSAIRTQLGNRIP